MKLLSKLSTLVKAMARGLAQPSSSEVSTPSSTPTSTPGDLPPAELAEGNAAIEQDQPLEGGRVADLLRRKLASSEPNPRQREKGD